MQLEQSINTGNLFRCHTLWACPAASLSLLGRGHGRDVLSELRQEDMAKILHETLKGSSTQLPPAEESKSSRTENKEAQRRACEWRNKVRVFKDMSEEGIVAYPMRLVSGGSPVKLPCAGAVFYRASTKRSAQTL